MPKRSNSLSKKRPEKTWAVHIRFSRDEYAAVVQRAKAEDRSIAATVRLLVKAGLKRPMRTRS